MHSIAAALALVATVVPLSSAHYTFSKLSVNDQDVGNDWQYIRQHTKGYMPTKIPDILDNDFRCQPGSFENAAKTDVYEVKPGDRVQFKQAFGGTGMKHPGATQVYFSKAPNNDVKSYQGDGDWVKADMSLLCSSPENGAILDEAWCSWAQNGPKFTIPDTLEAGEYLVRAEHIALHGAHDNGVEFYFACGQLKITGTTATGVLGETVKIPGVYQPDDPAIHFSVWNNAIKEYTPTPGPAVIPGGHITGSTTGSTTETVRVGGSGGASSNATSAKPSNGSSNVGASSGSSPSGNQDPSTSGYPTFYSGGEESTDDSTVSSNQTSSSASPSPDQSASATSLPSSGTFSESQGQSHSQDQNQRGFSQGIRWSPSGYSGSGATRANARIHAEQQV
ncbi:hypothetical protein CB0940_11641 [Cercospora beticola]|uniref:AA9 family lytic polysaccharide monooxygenase n=1 Tax=Cercospora beticola TaxID=122368 RepID=A0A2G5IE38_CERBT|nr:hypothetical protein CB0940_11641 [Cercospora beticola]PIB03000.1 hypothetical protein CB0940_11641 [Cercospora beticola]WPB03990.1 hypothetical protein RHO25_008634 [Cercospora beticola]